MMRQRTRNSGRLGMARWSVTAFSLAVLCALAQAEESRTVLPPVVLSGAVVDVADEPVANATVTLVAASQRDQWQYNELDPDRARIQTVTTADGGFELSFARDDQRFLLDGPSILIVNREGFQPHLVNLPMARLLVDVPLDVQVSPASSATIEIRSAQGDALQGVEVFPASINGRRIPWTIAREMTAGETDSQGRGVISQVGADSLDGVFVAGSKIGLQRRAVRRGPEGTLYAQVSATRAIDGRITAPGQQSIEGIAAVKMFIISRPSATSSFLHHPLECTWQIVPVTRAGSFRVPNLGLGEVHYQLQCPAGFAFRESRKTVSHSLLPGSGPQRWEIEFQKQVKLKAKVIDADSGEPLANILINTMDGRLEPITTNENGEAEFFRIIDNVSYYPRDVLGEFFYADAFYLNSKKLPVDGEIELEPVSLNRSSQWQGRVVDQNGQGVAGAEVSYDYALERFNESGVVFSDSEGNFRLTGIADRTAVKLRATRGNSASQSSSVVVPTKDPFRLQMVPRLAAKPAGRLVDLRGQPVAGVSVTLKRGTVLQKESYNAEQLMARDVYDASLAMRTDSSGRFVFPETIRFQQPLRIQIQDPIVFPYFSPYVDGSQLAADGEMKSGDQLDLGEFTVMRRPASRAVKLSVQSPAAEPVAGARVVVVGARTGTIRGTTDDSGRLPLALPEGRAVLAVAANGYPIEFLELPAKQQSLRVVLRSETGTPADRSVRSVNPQRFMEAAARIFADVQPLQPKASTFHQLRTHLSAMAFLDPGKFLAYLEANVAKNPQLGQVALLAAPNALSRNPEMIEVVMDHPMVPQQYLYGLMVEAAKSTDDVDLQEEWLAEALVSARSQSGPSRLFGVSGLAGTVLSSGRIDLAKEIVQELWSGQTQLQEIVQSGERELLIGESRTIGPMLSIVDRDASAKLIELAGREIEIPRLTTEALLNWGVANPDEFAEQLRGGGLAPIHAAGVQSWLRVQTRNGELAKVGIPVPDELAQQIDDAKVRLQFLLYHARMTSDWELRRRLVQSAVAAIDQSGSSASDDFYAFHYTGMMLGDLRKFQSIDPASLDQLVFAALWNLPSRFETDRLHTVLGAAAQIVAYRDRQLARVMLEPAMQDRGWLFMGRQATFERNETLASVARIDPDWSVEIVDQLCELEMANNPTDQLEVRSGMVTALMSMHGAGR